MRVAFYSAEVKYTGAFEDHTQTTFFLRARAKAHNGVDCFDYEEEYDDETAKELDGNVTVTNKYPCNKIALVEWSYIIEDDDEYEYEDNRRYIPID